MCKGLVLILAACINCRVVHFQVPLEVCCVLPTYFEVTWFLSRYCGALCFIFCQVIITECPDIYSCMSGHLREWRRDTGPGNIQPMMCIQVKKKKNNCDLCLIYATPSPLQQTSYGNLVREVRKMSRCTTASPRCSERVWRERLMSERRSLCSEGRSLCPTP